MNGLASDDSPAAAAERLIVHHVAARAFGRESGGMSDATRIVIQRNVRLAAALRACAMLRGQNVFLDHALDSGGAGLRLPARTRLVGYPAQEKAFLVFLKTLEPHLPRTPTVGPGSTGELVLHAESGAKWHVAFRYGKSPEIRVRTLAWLDVPTKAIQPLASAPRAVTASGRSEILLVDPDGSFVALRVAATTVHMRRGSAGEKGRVSKKVYAHRWQAEAALERAMKTLRARGFRRRNASAR